MALNKISGIFKNKRFFSSKWLLLAAVGCAVFLCAGAVIIELSRVKTETEVFQESSRELQNPNRGFYFIYGFYITDEKTEYPGLVAEKYKGDEDTRLALIEINLQEYREGKISDAGLANIDALFYALESADKQLIVRFLYDWEGKNQQVEPENMDIILLHMDQLKDILHRHSEVIFTLQGLFVGNWGEMNGTQFDSKAEFQILAEKLADVTAPTTYLAVRTPTQWRDITRIDDLIENPQDLRGLSARLGLFNDGMLGNESDWGTYTQREEELLFQERLCSRTPNGGEVIADNPYNDFENAVRDMAAMHVTYINRDYDRAVLEKWQRASVEGEGCFNGLDGLTYIERRLGYRLFIAGANVTRKFLQDSISVEISFQNAGFAPLYNEPEVSISLRSSSGKEVFAQTLPQKLRELTGGQNRDEVLTLEGSIPFKGLPKGSYSLYLTLVDPASGEHILLANEQNETEFGYRIGTIQMQ